jgi:inner membrane transporter RhtA
VVAIGRLSLAGTVPGVGRAATSGERRAQAVPPTLLVLGAVSSVQFGAALAKTLFDEIGAGGTVFLRVLAAAVVLALIWRPRLTGSSPRDLRLAVAFGLVLAGMNLAFYSALDRLPLGIVVTFEFVGPLGVAVFGSRKPLDLLWVVLAAAGILLLSDFGRGDLDTLGVGLALLAGACWAAYILLGVRVGQVFAGGSGLALAMLIATVPLAPVGIAEAGSDLIVPWILVVGAAVGILSSAIPYTLELEALRRMPAGVFGVLMSLEPAVAALAGFVVLGEGLAGRELAAILLVVAASAGAARGASVAPRDA